jgi:prepilin-type N-terminal cleavage/methylation domain-containing protein
MAGTTTGAPRISGRPGFTLLELLVAVAIVAVLIGLVVPAVVRVRTTAIRTRVANQLRQISLAQQHYVTNHGPLHPPGPANRSRGGGDVFGVILPYLEQQVVETPTPHGLMIQNYVSAGDPSIAFYPSEPGNCSFAVNALTCWRSGVTIPAEVTDGTSNTVAFAERYARCQRQNVIWSLGTVRCFDPRLGQEVLCGLTADRRANFADRTFVDSLPVSGPTPGTTVGSIPDLTFQVNPRPDACDGRVVQGAFPSGLLVAMADSSVRTLGPAIQTTTYWGLVTPDGGEVLGDW